jgi:predicted hydrocarbon binding protein
MLVPQESEAAPENQDLEEARATNGRLSWRLNHAKGQLGLLLQKIEPEIVPDVRRKILQEMGRNCARSLRWAEKYKGDPQGFFEHMRKQSGENVSFDEGKRKIRVVTRERDCDCPIINSSSTPGYYCDCSIGWQLETYETILGVPVTVEVKESVLRGAKRCVFEITILQHEQKSGEPGATDNPDNAHRFDMTKAFEDQSRGV